MDSFYSRYHARYFKEMLYSRITPYFLQLLGKLLIAWGDRGIALLYVEGLSCYSAVVTTVAAMAEWLRRWT